ncbi:MAG: hypothetical protein ABEJ87_00220 [Candidatus Nanohalobium sp.]
MKKSAVIGALLLLSGTVAGLKFHDTRTVDGKVNSSPPMPGGNLTVKNSTAMKSSPDSSRSEGSNSGSDFHGALDHKNSGGFFSNILQGIMDFIPFI